jgi:BASS family bile acid:Na+ symporter
MILDLFIPAIVVLLMVSAGTGVRMRQFALVLRTPRILLGGTLAQLLLLPLLALLLVRLVDPGPALAAGLVLVAACPGGALSNFYCYLGRLNVSLSVVLTALSSLLAFVTLPLLLAFALPMVLPTGAGALPVNDMALRLLFFLLLPIATGMAIRHWQPGRVAAHAEALRRIGLVLLFLLLALILAEQWETILTTYRTALWLSGLFTLCAVAVGWLVAVVVGGDAGARPVFAIEFAVRNLGAAALVASATLGRPDFLAFGAVFVVVQLPLMLLLLRAWRLRSAAAPAT